MKDIFNPWVIAGSVVIASILLVGTFFISGFISGADYSPFYGEAAITIIPIPTATSTSIPPTPIFTPTSEPVLGIQIGGYVQVTGTEGEGLRLRETPSLNGKIIYLGLEDEVFLVTNGPEDKDGYLWWYLETPLNKTKSGWAVDNFLELAQSP
jgi:hypothetical protein